VDAGFYAINLGNDAKVGGSAVSAKSEWQVAPQIYYAQPVNEDLVWGFGLNSPFGLGTEWGRSTPFSPVITEALETEGFLPGIANSSMAIST